MRRLFFHIGRMKTGTTAIQRFLYGSPHLLLDQGYYYPKTGLFEQQHAQLAWSCFSGFKESEWFPKLKYDGRSVAENVHDLLIELDKYPQASTIILSSELLTQRQPREFKELFVRLAAHFELTLVCYLRPQNEAVQSSYKQQVLYKGVTTKWSDFTLAEADFYSGNIPYFDYFLWLEQWSVLLGDNKLLLRPYKKDQVLGVLPDFLETLGFNHDVIDPEWFARRENLSIDVSLLDYICHVNRYIPVEHRAEFIQDLKRIPLARTGGSQELLFPEVALRKFEKTNKKLAQKYFNQCSMPW